MVDEEGCGVSLRAGYARLCATQRAEELNLTAMKPSTIDICYLCGQSLAAASHNDDHVPPRHLYSREIRSTQNLSHLLTLPTHTKCNSSFHLDEQYFIHTFIPLAVGSVAATSLWSEIRGQYVRGKNIPLRKRALAEFDERPSGLVLPYGKVIKRFDPQRVWRVVWKITRGLFFHKLALFLPEDTPRGFAISGPDEEPPRWFPVVGSQPSQGQYPRVFDYKYTTLDYPAPLELIHIWAMLFWDRLITVTYFHAPSCKCEQCKR